MDVKNGIRVRMGILHQSIKNFNFAYLYYEYLTYQSLYHLTFAANLNYQLAFKLSRNIYKIEYCRSEKAIRTRQFTRSSHFLCFHLSLCWVKQWRAEMARIYYKIWLDRRRFIFCIEWFFNFGSTIYTNTKRSTDFFQTILFKTIF